MPKIVQDQGILDAAREAIEVLLEFKGVSVALNRGGTRVAMPSGGHKPLPPITLAPQTFALDKVGDDIADDSEQGNTSVLKREYVLTGRYNADIRQWDKWEDAEAKYRVDTVDNSNGYSTIAQVTGFVKAP